MTGNTSGRRFLRPPSTVSRKSQSFNAADRNKIHDVELLDNNVVQPTDPDWKSRSINAKHSFTHQQGPQSRVPSPSKVFKKPEKDENSSKIGQKSKFGSKLAPPSSKLTKLSKSAKADDVKSPSMTSQTSNSSAERPSRLANPKGKPESKLQPPPSKVRSGLVPPKTSVSRSASNSSKSSAATATSPDRKTSSISKPKAGTKSSISVLSRLRRKTDSTSSSSNKDSTTSKNKESAPSKLKDLVKKPPPTPSNKESPATKEAFYKNPSTNPTESSSLKTRESKISKDSHLSNGGSKSLGRTSSSSSDKPKTLIPPSKLGTYKPKSATSSPARSFLPTASSNQNSLNRIRVPSNIGGRDDEFRTKSEKTSLPRSTTSSSRSSQASNHKVTIEGNEIIIVADDDETNKRLSGEENRYRRDRIDVSNLNSLLVRPYEGHNARSSQDMMSRQPGAEIIDNNICLTNSEDISQSSADFSTNSYDTMEQPHFSTFQQPRNFEPNTPHIYDLASRNVQLPGSSENRKAPKTATVAPFCRKVPDNGDSFHQEPSKRKDSVETEKSISSNEDLKYIKENATPKIISLEERRKTAKGIADLRQNLEETMVTLRNSQLKNRLSDEFERRISSQVDNEIEEIGLPEVPPPLDSTTAYRSTEIRLPDHLNSNSVFRMNNHSISGTHSMLNGSHGPQLDAGESLGNFGNLRKEDSTPKYIPTQRPQSGGRSVWMERPNKKTVYKDDIDDISSVSSDGISELITGIDTDDISVPSTADNSPFHDVARPSFLPKSNNSNSIESLEKSSTSTNESNKSLTSRKKTKSGSKSDIESKSKKKNEKKNSNKENERGSSIVGSRLAGADRSGSPTSSPAPISFMYRNAHSYRSLPRMKKLDYSDLTGISQSNGNITQSNRSIAQPSSSIVQSRCNIAQSGAIRGSEQNSHEGFVRSPALKLLLRSKANKKFKANLEDAANETSQLSQSSAERKHYDVALTKPGDNIGYHSNNSVKVGRNSDYGLSMNATQSLPRRFTKKAGSTTWSQPRSNPNSAYSLPATPDDAIYDQYGSYIDNSGSMNSFSNLTVPDFDNFTSAMDRSFQTRNRSFDWNGLQSSMATSSPNVNRAAYRGRNYRTISSTNDLFKRRGSSLSLGASSHAALNQLNDENSIAMARSFLQSLAQNDVVHEVQMVQDFEKSLSYLTSRLRDLTITSEEKDSQLQELRTQIESLKRKSEQTEQGTESKMKLKKKLSSTSLSSMSSQASISSTGSADEKQKKKRGWFKSSFKFGKTKSKSNLLNNDQRSESPLKNQDCDENNSNREPETVQKLKEELRQKERKLTDTRLEALTSRHQLQHLQDTMNQMRSEIESLRKENEQLHQLGLSAYTMTSSPSFLQSKLNGQNESKLETIRIKFLVEIDDFTLHNSTKSQFVEINVCPILKSSSWEQLDLKIMKIFIAYCQTIDPTGCIKLDKTSIESYTVGDGIREIGDTKPELLPCGYLVGNTDSVVIKLRDGRHNHVDSLAFELLVDKTIAERYIDTLLQQQRIVICSHIGTCKTLLANRIAGYVAKFKGSINPVLYMDAKQKELQELEEFLNNIATADDSDADNVKIIVLDNLQSIKRPQELLEPFANIFPLKGVYLICVTNKKVSGLERFAWITWTNNTPPVQTYLARKLRRSYLEHQIKQNHSPTTDDVLSLVITWLPKCWQHINDFLELTSGPNVTIGPRMFSSCPMDASSARVWFTDLWNFSIVPYVTSAVRQSALRKDVGHWTDPTEWVLETMPWKDTVLNLMRIRPEDIGPSPTDSDHSTSQSCDMTSQASSSDPLYNMLMKLQEAAKYDSDTNSNHEDNFELSIDKALTELG